MFYSNVNEASVKAFRVSRYLGYQRGLAVFDLSATLLDVIFYNNLRTHPF